MAVPKKFKFKIKKISFKQINNNQNYIQPFLNKYFLKKFRFSLKKEE